MSKRIKEWINKGEVTALLDLSFLNLTTIDELPVNLLILHCENNQLTSLPRLPDTLQILYCNNNQLTSLPPLPDTLQYLDCYNNYFLFNWSRVQKKWWNHRYKHAWNNYRILCKLQRIFRKRKRRRYYLCCKDIITNDISGLVVRYL